MKKVNRSSETHRNQSFTETAIFKEIHQRIFRLLLTAIVLLVSGIIIFITTLKEHNIIYTLFSGILCTVSIYQFYLVFKQNENIFEHPDMIHFLKWGNNAGNIIALMDKELRGNRDEESGTIFTESFALFPRFYSYSWIHFSEICWGYNSVTQHYTNFIPTGKTFEVHIMTNDGNCIKIGTNDKSDLLKKFVQLSPFAIFGFSEELKEKWYKDNENFVHMVKSRLNDFHTDPEKFFKDHF